MGNDEFLEKFEDYFKEANIKLEALMAAMKASEEAYLTIRKKFKRSVMKYDDLGHNILKMLDCHDMRRLAMMVLGNTCYESAYTYNSTWLAFSMILGSYVFLVLSMIAFVEGMIESRVLEKYLEANKDGKFGIEFSKIEV